MKTAYCGFSRDSIPRISRIILLILQSKKRMTSIWISVMLQGGIKKGVKASVIIGVLRERS